MDSSIPGKPEEYLDWAVQTTTADAQNFSDLLVAANFWSKWKNGVEQLDSPDAVERALAVAKFEALGRSFSIHDLPERSSAKMLLDAKMTGWHMHLPAEYSDLTELMSSLLLRTGDSNESSRRDIQFAVDTLFPALMKAGVDAKNILEIPNRWSKTRVAIPHIRAALDQLDEDELPEFLKGIVDIIADSNISVRDMRKELSNKGYKDHPEVSGDVYQLERDKFLFVAVVNGEGLNFLAKVFHFTINDVLKPFSKFAEFVKKLVRSDE